MRNLLYLILFLPLLSIAQSYNIGHTTVTFIDDTRARSVVTEIYYPSDETGEDVAASNGSYPVIVFGHGFLIGWESYSNFWSELVPNGYILCFPTTEMGLSPDHEALGEDLKFVAEKMHEFDYDSSSIFFNSIMPKTAIMGHSMGGGASFLSSSFNTSINTLINFAAAETTPSAILAATNVNIPTLIFSGEDDCVAPALTNQVPMYDALNSSRKTLISIKNGGHCYFANDNFACNFGESFCNSELNIDREQQQNVTFDFLNLWLDYTLYNYEYALDEFNDSLQSSIRINFQQLWESVGINQDLELERFKIFPNPVIDKLNIDLPQDNCNGYYSISTVFGQIVQQNEIQNCSSSVNVSYLPKGVYLFKYSNQDRLQSTLFIK